MEIVKKQKKHAILDRPILATILLELAYMVILNIMAVVPLAQSENPVIAAVWNCVSYIVPALLLTLFVGRRLGKGFIFGYRKDNLLEGLKLSWFFFVWSILGFIVNINSGMSIAPGFAGFVVALLGALAAGVSEEVYSRGIYCNLMMRKWSGKNAGIWAAVVVSSLFFGLKHLMNALVIRQITEPLVWQVLYATALGILFAAIYVRTRNLWGIMVAHTFFDFLSMWLAGTEGGGETEAIASLLMMEMNNIDRIQNVALIVLALAISIFLLRPAKMPAVRALWQTEEEQAEAAAAE